VNFLSTSAFVSSSQWSINSIISRRIKLINTATNINQFEGKLIYSDTSLPNTVEHLLLLQLLLMLLQWCVDALAVYSCLLCNWRLLGVQLTQFASSAVDGPCSKTPTLAARGRIKGSSVAGTWSTKWILTVWWLATLKRQRTPTKGEVI
jgi:hypothetical protein